MSKHNNSSRGTFIFFLFFVVFFISFSSIFLVYHGHSLSDIPSFNSFSSSSFTRNILGTTEESVNQPSNPINYKNLSKFYTPTEIQIVSPTTVRLSLCALNFEDYSKNPHEYSMFRFLVGNSNCVGGNIMTMDLKSYLKKIEEERLKEREQYLIKTHQSLDILHDEEEIENIEDGRLRYAIPKLFVFHESRVGSTLVANLLASDPYSMVFSESSPIIDALLHCNVCDHDQKVSLFRDVIKAMSVSRFHKNLFVKFQSIGSTGMALALEAFPEIAWTYVYRNPVQTIMSHLDPLKGSSGAPCLRSKSNPSQHLLENFEKNNIDRNHAPKEAWCAAHLEMLCSNAIDAYSKFAYYPNSNKLRGIFTNYESLPGSIPRVVLPLANVNLNQYWLDKMKIESQEYSKSGARTKPKFTGDSEDKESRSTEAINKYSKLLLEPTYLKMDQMTQQALEDFKEYYSDKTDSLFKDVPLSDYNNYESIKTLPISLDSFQKRMQKKKFLSTDPLEIPHSPLLIENYFSSTSPFANDHNSKRFEAIDCTLPPTEDYPKAYPLFDVLNNWNPDNVDIPKFHYDSLCHFDFQNPAELAQAKLYQKHEKPFILYNIPQLDEISSKWSTFDYLIKKVGNTKFRTESSKSNHFMYWKPPSSKFLRNSESKNWEEPTKVVRRSLPQWLDLAVKGQSEEDNEKRDHEYFRLNSDPDNYWIYDDLPFFNPDDSFSSEPFPFLVDSRQQRGIHCRLGMKSIIAEAHFDASRNMVVELAGLRRWILAHPNMCGPLDLYPPSHPSARHSKGDWSKPETLDKNIYGSALVNEVILRPGDALFVPTDWIHYIISLNVNIQCNTRSGVDRRYRKDLAKCGFNL